MNPVNKAMDLEIVLESGDEECPQWTRFMAVGKIHANKTLNQKGVMAILRSIWSEEIAPGIREIHDLPLEMLSNKNAKIIGQTIGSVINIDEPTGLKGFGQSFLRIRVGIKVDDPLICGFWVPRRNRGKLWAKIRYERLADFCYSCGKLGHLAKHCDEEVKNDMDGRPLYGPHLRASSFRMDYGKRDNSMDSSKSRVADDLSLSINENVKNLREVSCDNWSKNENQRAWRRNVIGDMEVESEVSMNKGKQLLITDGLENQNTGPIDETTPPSHPSLPKPLPADLHISIPVVSLNPDPTHALGVDPLNTTFNFPPLPIVSKNPTLIDKPNSQILGTSGALTSDSTPLMNNPMPHVLVPNDQDPVIPSLSHSNSIDGTPGPMLSLGSYNTSLYPVLPGPYDPSKYPETRREDAYEWDTNSKEAGIEHELDEVSSPFKGIDNVAYIIERGGGAIVNCHKELEFDEEFVEQDMRMAEYNLAADLNCLQLKRNAENDAKLHPVEIRQVTTFTIGSETIWKRRAGRKKYKKTKNGRENWSKEEGCSDVLIIDGCSAGRFLGWNDEPGIGSSQAVNVLHDLKKKSDPDFIFLMETKNKKDTMEKIRRNIKMDNALYVDPVGLSGGIALWWKNNFVVNSFEEHKNLVDTLIVDVNSGVSFRIFWIYGAPVFEDRKLIWEKVKLKAVNIEEVWCCIGDFNDILDDSEKEGGGLKDRRYIRCFQEMVEQCQLIDIQFQGQKFTWMGKREGIMVKERLDRALVNSQWLANFPKSQLVVHAAIRSDHSPIVLYSCFGDTKGPKKFKFEAQWVDMEAIRQELCVSDEDVKWISGCKEQRRQFNKILRIKNEDGVWLEKEEGIMEGFCKFYENLFTSEGNRNWDHVLKAIPCLVSEEDNTELIKDVTDEEIVQAVFQMGMLKSPGPDGFNGLFYQHYWDVIGEDVKKMVRSFFHKGRMLREMNATEIVLIPKVKGPERSFSFFEGEAYDRVEWDFLHALLLKLGYNSIWTDWILECVRCVSYTIVINGKSSRMILPSRGLRQGDPLSPYLFLLVIDALSRLIQVGMDTGYIEGLKLAINCPEISHLLFADDSLFFMNANIENCKSCNMGEAEKKAIVDTLGIQEAANPGTYLGIQNCWGKTKYGVMAYVKERMIAKLKGWKEKFLPMGGKEILIKAVACTMPTYVMSVFKIPKRVCKEMQSAVANYWWGQKEDERKIHWCNWQKLTEFKQDGGMGFKEFEAFNRAMLAKQAWRLIENPNALWARVLKGVYFHNCDFLEAGKGARPSWVWSSLLEGRDLFKEHMMWVPMDGKQISIWQDRWIPNLAGRVLSNPGLINDNIPQKVEEIMNKDLGIWELDQIQHWLTEEEQSAIKDIPVHEGEEPDILIWPKDKSGKFTVKSGYVTCKNVVAVGNINRASSSHLVDKRVWKEIWKIKAPSKVKVFMWRMCMGALATNENLWKRKCKQDPLCELCGQEVETIEHMILTCEWTRKVWWEGCFGLKICKDRIRTMDQWILEVFLEVNNSHGDVDIIKSTIAYTCWIIWNLRCQAIIEHKSLESVKAIQWISSAVKEYYMVCTGKKKSDRDVASEVFWEKPQDGWCKINCDGAYCHQSKQAGIGVVVRDAEGHLLHGLGKQVKGDSALMIEAIAVKTGLKLAKEMRLSNIIVEMDSEVLYKNIVDRGKNRDWRIGPILADIDHLSTCIDSIKFNFVKRNANLAADWIATRSRTEMSFADLSRYQPSSLVQILNKDGLPAPHC
ncbi:reverse transcriptase [Corchorus capsularis]|uniref:Reverse transcriptase n=1 Tax=Corchorus capsularis TaxID=210143 RepID=A0A1R3JGU0_COCAP|nr:reverse transcriptase [Corchorus capsularis]